MKNFVVVLVLAVVGLALPHPSQAAGVMMGVPGYYDPTTSTFVPIVTPKTFPLATVTRTGTFKLTVTLSIEPAIGVDEPITCQASNFDVRRQLHEQRFHHWPYRSIGR